MGSERARLTTLLLGFLGLGIAALFVMDWFVVKASFMGVSKISIDLRGFTACTDVAPSPCVSMSFGKMRGIGLYPMFAQGAFYGTIVFGLLVIYQAATRLISGFASVGLTKLGYFTGVSVMSSTVFAAYFFGPDLGSMSDATLGVSIEVTRSWAPLMLLGAQFLGMLVCYYGASQGSHDDEAPYKPIDLPAARAVERTRAASEPIPTAISERIASEPVLAVPAHARGKLSFATLSAEITRAGIDARREDGSSLLVMWRDVVGAVARRMPADYDGVTFVDVVSTAGSTLRMLPWSRLTGDPVEGDGEARARALVELVLARCPEAKLDPATRAFVDHGVPAAQLPDTATLAAHDQRLA